MPSQVFNLTGAARAIGMSSPWLNRVRNESPTSCGTSGAVLRYSLPKVRTAKSLSCRGIRSIAVRAHREER